MEKRISTTREPRHKCEACLLSCPLIYSCYCGMNLCPTCFDIGMVHYKSECESRFLSLNKIDVRLAQCILTTIRTEDKYDGSLVKWWHVKGQYVDWDKLGSDPYEFYNKIK